MTAQHTEVPAYLQLLGGFRLSIDGEVIVLPMNAQRLVAFLALQGRPVLRTFVFGSLWGGVSELRARGSLRSALHRLRHPRYQLISLSAGHLELSSAVTTDLAGGEVLAHQVIDTAHALDVVGEKNEEVLSADLLPDWTDEWVLTRRTSYHQLRVRALEALTRQLTATERFGQAVQAGVAAVAAEPLRESARAVLIEAHLGERNVAAALREFEDFRALLQAELGREPSRDLRALVARES